MEVVKPDTWVPVRLEGILQVSREFRVPPRLCVLPQGRSMWDGLREACVSESHGTNSHEITCSEGVTD